MLFVESALGNSCENVIKIIHINQYINDINKYYVCSLFWDFAWIQAQFEYKFLCSKNEQYRYFYAIKCYKYSYILL
jgi:hypothetical protein